MKNGKRFGGIGIAIAVGLGLYWLYAHDYFNAYSGYGGYGGGQMGGGMMSGGMGILMGIFWLLILAGLVLTIRWVLNLDGSTSHIRSEATAEEILRRRFAQGEIDAARFNEMIQTLHRPQAAGIRNG